MKEPGRQPEYVFEGFRLDAQRRVLFGADGQPVPLTSRLFDTLLYLVERPGELLTKAQLLEAIWPNVVVEEHNLNKSVSTLRRALGERPGEHRFIVTQPGLGYRFVAEVSVVPTAGPAPDPAPQLSAAPDSSSGAAPAPSGASTARLTPRRRWAWLALGGIATAVTAGAWLSFGRPTAESTPQLRITPLSALRGGQAATAWSPDGSRIAYSARESRGEPWAVYVRNLAEPTARRVFAGDEDATVAQWTSAGRILFYGESGLWSVSPVGAPPEFVLPLDPSRFYARFLPFLHVSSDGSTIAGITHGDDGWAVSTARVDDGEFVAYEPAPFAAQNLFGSPRLKFSPDGRQLLLIWNAARGGDEAWLLPFPADAGRPPRRVLEGLPEATGTIEFSWLPDSRHIVLSTGEDAARLLYVADTESGEFRPLSIGHSDPWRDPIASPQGDRLTFNDFRIDFDLVTFDLGTAQVRPFLSTRRSEEMPSWAAGGDEALVYVTDGGGTPEIWLHRPGEADRPLVTASDFQTPTQDLLLPTLSPDGSRLIYWRVEGAGVGASRLWMSAVAGGAPERVTSTDAFEIESAGSWSPDGLWYAYTVGSEEVGRVLKKVRTTGQAAPETELIGDVGGSPALWSPSGEWILVNQRVDQRPTMKLVSPDGETVRNLVDQQASCAFARSEDLLYCILQRPMREGMPVVALDFDGNLVRAIGVIAPADVPTSRAQAHLSLTPDGSGLTYSTANISMDLWLMEGLATATLP